MKFNRPIFLLFLLVGTAAAQTQDLNQLSWMSGTWAGTQGGLQMEEHWTTVKGGTLIGIHRDVSGERTVSFEFLRIEKTAQGIAYIAQPQGRPPTSFLLVESSTNRVVFENKAHDFPQRITYWRERDSLHARVEGPQKGQERAMEWTWTRVVGK